MRWTLRAWTFLFNLLVALAALVAVSASGGQHNISIAILPLEGAALTRQLLLGAIYVLLACALALRHGRWSRLPMLIWNLAAPVTLAVLALRAGFRFESPDQALLTFYCWLAALAALAGSWLHWRSR